MYMYLLLCSFQSQPPTYTCTIYLLRLSQLIVFILPAAMQSSDRCLIMSISLRVVQSWRKCSWLVGGETSFVFSSHVILQCNKLPTINVSIWGVPILYMCQWHATLSVHRKEQEWEEEQVYVLCCNASSCVALLACIHACVRSLLVLQVMTIPEDCNKHVLREKDVSWVYI